MKVNNISNQKFNGYSNVICKDLRKDDYRSLFIAAKLDNRGGHHDLEEFRAFKKMYSDSPRKIDDDVIVMFYNKISPREETLFLGDEALFWGGELKLLPETYPAEEYAIIEKSHMKAYTLMASITKRIIEAADQPKYKGLQSVVDTCNDVFFALSKNFEASRTFVKDAVDITLDNPEKTMKHCSRELNSIIDKTMHVFFK